MTIEQILDVIRNDPNILANITHWQKIPEKPAEFAEFPKSLHSDLIKKLQDRGIKKLYSLGREDHFNSQMEYHKKRLQTFCSLFHFITFLNLADQNHSSCLMQLTRLDLVQINTG